MKPFTVADVAGSVLAHDDCPGVKLRDIETVLQIALQTVVGRFAAFSDEGRCTVDLGNGFVLSSSVQPFELTS